MNQRPRPHGAVQKSRSGLLILAAIFAAAAGAPPRSAPADDRPARITILLPADAELEINGEKVEGSGDLRRHDTAAISTDDETSVTLKATFKQEKRKRTVEEKVTVKGGQSVEVDFYGDKLTAEEKQVLELTNKEREKAGLTPLEANMKLVRAARGHSANMAKQGVLGHELDGKTFFQRIEAAHYRHGEAGENCARGQRTPADVVKSWMSSPGHRENLLNPNYQEIGVGAAAAKGGKYWTQLFAVPGGRNAADREARSGGPPR